MSYINKLISLGLIAGMFATGFAQADEWTYDNPGYGYEECCQASYMTPTIAIGVLAIAAIIIVAVQDSNGHSHGHSH